MLTWALYELSVNAAPRSKVIAEGEGVFKSATGTASGGLDKYQSSFMPGKDEMSKLEYTVSSLREALRKYSLVPLISRVAVEDDKIGALTIPAGTKLFLNLKVIHCNTVTPIASLLIICIKY